jgi:hypothetical protein
MCYLFTLCVTTSFPFSILLCHTFCSRRLTSIEYTTLDSLPYAFFSGWINGGVGPQKEIERERKRFLLDKSDTVRDCVSLWPQAMSDGLFQDLHHN